MEQKRIFIVSRLPLVLHSITSLLTSSGGYFVVAGTVSDHSGIDDLALANSDAAIIHVCPNTDLQGAIEFLQRLHRDFGLSLILLGDQSDLTTSELAMQDFVSGFVDHHVQPEIFRRRITEILELDARIFGIPVQDRRSPRLAVNIPVRIDGQHGESSNISATGLYLHIDRHRQYFVGEEVDCEIDLELPSGESILASRGQIVRIEDDGERLGIAIRILATSTLTEPSGS